MTIFKSATFVLLFTRLFLFTSSSSASTTALSDTPKRICSICRQTQNPDFCVNSLEGFLGGKKADMNRLAIVSILLATAQARLNKYIVKQLMQTELDPLTQFQLRVCQINYNAILERFQEAYRLSDKKDYKGMLDLVDDATTLTNECTNEFMQPQNPPSSLREDNQEMAWLNNIASVILGMLDNK